MSGIAAIFHADGSPVDESRIEAMIDAMSYRACDGWGAISAGPVSLGQCALHTNTADRGHARPFTLPQARFSIVFDGYLMNGPDLRRQLAERGAKLRSDRDMETVLLAYAEWGEAALPRFEGEFAFAIWDAAEKRLICARDHCGLRPLTWHWDGKCLLVASDIAGILAALKTQPPVNTGYLAEHLANEWYTRDETVWQSVRKLRPAHVMTVSLADAEPTVREYWSLPVDITVRYSSDSDYAGHYLEILDSAVLAASVTDAPLAAEVSGGLDSSAVFALAARAHKNGSLAAPALHAFTLRGPDGDYSDERAFARAVAEHHGHTLSEVPLFEPPLGWFTDQAKSDATLAFAPNAAMMTGLHAAIAEAGCRVCLNGHGGDTWLNGTNAQFNQALRLGDWRGAARSLAADRHDFGNVYAIKKGLRQGLGLIAPEQVKRMFRQRMADAPHELETLFWLTDNTKRELHLRRERFLAELVDAPAHERHKLERLKEPFTTLANEIVNLMGAKQGVEYRSPMQSRRFMEFSAATPEHIRRRGATRKWVHREAMRGILPEKVRDRKDKAFFDRTFQRLQPETQQYCTAQPLPPPMDELLHTDGVKALFDRFYSAKIDDGAIWELWGIYSIAVFCDERAVEWKT